MKTIPGYMITIEAFLPADPNDPPTMGEAAGVLRSLPVLMEGLEALMGVVVSHRFVQKHKVAEAEPAPEPEAVGVKVDIVDDADPLDIPPFLRRVGP